MNTIRLVVLAGVFCLSAAGALAQDNIPSVLVTNKDEEAIAKHRLTVQNVRQMFAVDRDLLTLMKEVPDLEARTAELSNRLDPRHLAGSLTLEAKVFEGIPETAQILRKQKMSGREYVLTKRLALGAVIGDEMIRREFGNDEIAKEALETSALRFWRTMAPALKAEAAEWLKLREEMARLGR
jgi:hypothetical protein